MKRVTYTVLVLLFAISWLASADGPPADMHHVKLNGHTFTLPAGFEIELAAAPPLVNRPIVADFDEEGRLYVADSSGSNEPVQQQLQKKPHRIVRLADTQGKGVFDKSIVYAIARQESAFAQTATSTAGAKGLMQLMPDTARRAAKHAGIALDMSKLNTDGSLNARIGAAHLGELLSEMHGSYALTFAAYNAGGKRVSEWIAAHGDPRRSNVDPVDWIELIPITETRDYVQHIIENMQVYRVRFDHIWRPIDEAELARRNGG